MMCHERGEIEVGVRAHQRVVCELVTERERPAERACEHHDGPHGATLESR